nr:lipocalin-like domain-containing protein [uncultured Chitinophaga sp.]
MKHLLCIAFMMSFTFVQGQDRKGISEQSFWGTWSLVSVENINADGSKVMPYGNRPAGMLVFTKDGRYAIQILKAGRAKVLSGDKNKATTEENALLVQGNNSHFGTYTIDAHKGVIVFSVRHAFFPNWEGIEQVRNYSFEDNLLTYIVTTPTNGGAISAKVVWRKDER